MQIPDKVFTIHQRTVTGRATGGPGASKVAAAFDRASQGPASKAQGKFSRPTFLVGEEDKPEFVIATNPAYREDNIRYLHMAASALGVEFAAKGRKPAPARAGRPSAGVAAKNYAVPGRIRFGGVPEDTVQGAYDTSDSIFQKKLGWEHDKPVKDKTESTKAFYRRLRRWRARNPSRKSLAALRRERNDRQADLWSIKRFNSEINDLNTQIDTQRLAMENASKTRDPIKFDGAARQRQHLIAVILDRLRKARGLAGKYPQYGNTLEQQIAAAEGQGIDTAQDKIPPPDAPSPLTMDDARVAGGPGDPAMHRAIADSAAAGAGYQGSVDNSRLSTGL
jgi:hypothetical protein